MCQICILVQALPSGTLEQAQKEMHQKFGDLNSAILPWLITRSAAGYNVVEMLASMLLCGYILGSRYPDEPDASALEELLKDVDVDL